MLDILKINLPGEADYSLLTQTEVPEELCFDTSRLIAVSIKIFFQEDHAGGTGAGRTVRGSVLFVAVCCQQC